VAQEQASKPLPAALGADGVPITLLLESISCICSEVVSLTGEPLTAPELNAGLVRLGSAAKPASVPISSGVSSIHLCRRRQGRDRRDPAAGHRRVGPYRAYSTARDSRMTVTLICPGYSSSFSISRAIS
jgi:hypothetical protein